MRFDFKTVQQESTWDELLAVWQVADELEVFESGWLFDHFYPFNSDPTNPCFDGWTTLTGLAQATGRLRLGVLVTGVVFRHPAVLAKMAVTVDHISRGRLDLGLGAGWVEEECDAYGIALGSVKERFDRFDEACEVIASLLTKDTTTFQGNYYTLTSARCDPKPLQSPSIPICIGGVGEKRTLPAVAKWAQHWNLQGCTVDEFRQKRDVLYSECSRIGRDPTEIVTSTHLRARPGKESRLVEHAAAFSEAGLDKIIVRLETPYSPADLEAVAVALRHSGLCEAAASS